jgi:hypothetical protein
MLSVAQRHIFQAMNQNQDYEKSRPTSKKMVETSKIMKTTAHKNLLAS